MQLKLKSKTKNHWINKSKYEDIGRFCGVVNPDNIVLSNTVRIHFKSDSMVQFSGFKIVFTTLKHLSSKTMEYLDGLKIMYQDIGMNLNSNGELVVILGFWFVKCFSPFESTFVQIRFEILIYLKIV